MIRTALLKHFTDELHGPANGPQEEVDEHHVITRYLLGMLAPLRNENADFVAAVEDGDAASALDTVEEGRDDALAEDSRQGSEDDGEDKGSSVREALIPSSFGMSFVVDGGEEHIFIRATWGKYERVDSETLTTEKGRPKKVWKRASRGGNWIALPLRDGVFSDIAADEREAEVLLQGRIERHANDYIVTLFLVNTQQSLQPMQDDERWLFQADLEVKGREGTAPFLCRAGRARYRSVDPQDRAEREQMDLLYRDRIEFVVGHGIAVHAVRSDEEKHRAERLGTRAIPRHEVPMQRPPDTKGDPAFAGLELDMRVLSELSPEKLIEALQPLPAAYGAWIATQQARLDNPFEGLDTHREAASLALLHCRRACERIHEGIAVLERDETAREAFAFANRVMADQRVRGVYTREKRRDAAIALEEADSPANRTWYPFQLAFLLMNLPALADPAHPDRTNESEATADLLWFPTGGGKTEAYLGLAAFTMAMRRLQPKLGGRDGSRGVAVLMRYTLRLLTLQQFQRAAALLCACETARREAPARWGVEPFRVGLWVGGKTTPNSTAKSDEAVRQLRGSEIWNTSAAGIGSPHQITNCPWCGRSIDKGRDIVVESFAKGRARTLIYCGDPDGACAFSRRQAPDEGLPLLLVDEEIYRRLPDLLIATVDKFAQMPWNGAVQMLFGQVQSECSRHGFRSPEIEDQDSHNAIGRMPKAKSTPRVNVRPPDLIIQDELHLISGPLGSLVGLYETAIDELCAWDVDGRRVHPKIVASTATVRRASEQVRQVFARALDIFPPPGLDVSDNFFSREQDVSKEPGRLYLGVCAPGFRLKSVLIRVYTALLASAQTVYESHGKAADPYMTLAGYFNSLRELGGMRRLVEDDVRSRLWHMQERGLSQRGAPNIRELTSRIDAVDIPEVLDHLEADFDPAKDAQRRRDRAAGKRSMYPKPIDVLLATNMLSVGVDIGRLGLMVVAGQPKSTSEYIQATSRIGRRHPGLVVTVFNWARPRDMSHYETFEHYHASFYRHVEALSVTPYSRRALDRGLTAVLASMIRLSGPEYNANESAADLDRNHKAVERAVQSILARASSVLVDPAAVEDVRTMLTQRLDAWRDEAVRRSKAGARLGYRAGKETVVNLLRHPGDGSWGMFHCLQSLRDVEREAHLVLSYPDTRGSAGEEEAE